MWCMHACMYACMYVCMYACTCIYTSTHIYNYITHTWITENVCIQTTLLHGHAVVYHICASISTVYQHIAVHWCYDTHTSCVVYVQVHDASEISPANCLSKTEAAAVRTLCFIPHWIMKPLLIACQWWQKGPSYPMLNCAEPVASLCSLSPQLIFCRQLA